MNPRSTRQEGSFRKELHPPDPPIPANSGCGRYCLVMLVGDCLLSLCIHSHSMFFKVLHYFCDIMCIFTDRVRSTTGRLFWLVSVLLPVHIWGGGGGGTRTRSSWGVPQLGVPHLGYPPGGPGWGVPHQGGSPPQVPPHWTWPGVPQQGSRGGYPTSGTPHQTWPGGYLNGGVPHLGYTPPVRPGQGGTLMGGTPPRVTPPHQTWPGGYPNWRVPHLMYPPSDLAGGTPMWGYPTLVKPPPPPLDLARGTPMGGTPPWVSPQSDLAGGGYPDGGGENPTSVVLDTPRSVCLLRSRRTFLYINWFIVNTFKYFWLFLWVNLVFNLEK